MHPINKLQEIIQSTTDLLHQSPNIHNVSDLDPSELLTEADGYAAKNNRGVIQGRNAARKAILEAMAVEGVITVAAHDRYALNGLTDALIKRNKRM